jgi:hypothetical protein
MVDKDRILRLLRSITDDVAVLRREASADESRREDPIWLRGVKYTFVTAIEACVDVAQHICATEGPPRDPLAHDHALLFARNSPPACPMRPARDRHAMIATTFPRKSAEKASRSCT